MPAFKDYPIHLARLREAALQAVEPAAAVARSFTSADIEAARRVFVVGAGKAGGAMARAAAHLLGARLAAGVLAVPQPPVAAPARITFIEGGHPVPTEGSLAAGQAIANLLAQTTPADLVLALISGGGSALLELLRPGLRLADLQAVNTALLKCGATINEINLVRPLLSRLKGGGLARLAYPARVLSLILSDVVGNPLDIIASGPTVPKPVSAQAALTVVDKYHLRSVLPPAVMQVLLQPPPEEELLPEIDNRLIASNRLAGEAAAEAARALGFATELLGDDWQGEARAVGPRFAREVLARARPACLIAGGETTVTVRGNGKGGRNQEAALAAAQTLAGQANIALCAFATDGMDGPTDAAGAIVTGETIPLAQARGLDSQAYLANNNAYVFFDQLGGLLRTGLTGTNVNDLWFGLAYGAE